MENKTMHSFTCDYSEGAHPSILKRLAEVNLTQHPGYGEDSITHEAIDIIRQKTGNPQAAVYFVIGGTQANMTVISSLLRPHEGVICADGGHIWSHETGAIEATGHRVITAGGRDGKLRPEDISHALEQYTMRPHVLKPAMVYISDPTEIGTIYTKAELEALHTFCKGHGLLLYVDGARLGSALTAQGNDLTLHDLTCLTDVFYIGGTKNGALMGEAIVFNDPALCPDFDYMRKEHGALLAKGWLLGLQFSELLRDDLYFRLAEHANRQADRLRRALNDGGYRMLVSTPTNQIFPILSDRQIAELRKKYVFEAWERVDDSHAAVRFVTSWATTEEATAEFAADILACKDL